MAKYKNLFQSAKAKVFSNMNEIFDFIEVKNESDIHTSFFTGYGDFDPIFDLQKESENCVKFILPDETCFWIGYGCYPLNSIDNYFRQNKDFFIKQQNNKT